jgi:hypothetical protein
LRTGEVEQIASYATSGVRKDSQKKEKKVKKGLSLLSVLALLVVTACTTVEEQKSQVESRSLPVPLPIESIVCQQVAML